MKLNHKKMRCYFKFIYPAVIIILSANLFSTVYSASGSPAIKSTPALKSSPSPKRTPSPKITPSLTPSPTITATPTSPPSTWTFGIEPGKELNVGSSDIKWVSINGQLYAITIENGQIVVFISDNDGNWSEFQRFGPEDSVLTTFQLSEINGDNIPEIVAGTVDPGFISIYKFVGGKWVLNNYERYVWSSITNIAIGSFDGVSKDLLVQNQEGFLFLLKISVNSLDLIWKSPIAWRPINSFSVLDINKDMKDEIIATYKTGGIGILKMDNNQIVSVWENYVWGKILATANGDWNSNNQPEFIFSTSQKVIYFLGYENGKGYQFQSQLTQLNYTVEQVFFRDYRGAHQLFLTDTSGKTHLIEYNPAEKLWTENFWCNTGRIAGIINSSEDLIMLFGQNHKVINLRAFPTKDLKLRYLDQKYELNPAPLVQNSHIYISPALFIAIPDLGVKYSFNKKGVATLNAGETMIEFFKKDLSSYKVNNAPLANTEQYIFLGDNLYLTNEFYQKYLNLNFEIDPVNKNLVLTVWPSAMSEQNIPASQDQEDPPLDENKENLPVAENPATGTASNQ